MKLMERFKSKYSSLVNADDQSKIDRLLITVLSCIVLLVIVIVRIVGSSRVDAYDAIALLVDFRLLILTGVGITGGIFIILAINRTKLEWLFLALSLGLGLMYMFAMTPLSIPDEAHHYLTSSYLSSLMLDWGGTVFTRISDWDFSGLAPHFNVPTAYLRFFEEGIRPIESETHTYFTIYLPYFLQYLPQAIGISIGRLFQLNFFGLFYLGRLFNLLFFVLCGFFAVRSLKEFKLPIFIIAILPMTLHQAASFSNDSFVNGASILFVAYLIRCLYERDEWSRKDIAVLTVVGILLAPAKTVYFPIILLLLFAAPYKYGWKKAKGYIVAGAIFVAGAATIFVFNWVSLQSTLASAPVERWHGATNYTLNFIFENPWETVLIFLRTIWVFGRWYFLGLFGRELAGLSIVMPVWYVYVFMFILAASLFYGKKGSWVPTWLQRVVFIAVCAAVVVMSMLGMFLAWTPDTHPYILGLQGRYFIPILPLAVLILRHKFMIDRRLFAYTLIGGATIMHFIILRYVLDSTIWILPG